MNFAPFLNPTECHGADSHSWHPSRSVFGECPNSLNSGFRVELASVSLDACTVFFFCLLLLLLYVLLWSHPSYMFPIVHRSLVWLCILDTSSFPVFWMDCLFQEFSAAFSGRYSAVGMLSRDSVRDVGCPYLLHTLPCLWMFRVSAKFLFLHLLASAIPTPQLNLRGMYLIPRC